MPALICHWLFADAALQAKSCPTFSAKERQFVYLGAQGPDPFYFNGQLPWARHSKTATTSRAFAGLCHSSYPEFWLEPLLKGLKQAAIDLQAPAQALIYGFFLHYMLDRLAHPYVFSKSGFDAQGELSPPWNIRHAWFETLLDLSFLQTSSCTDQNRCKKSWKLLHAETKKLKKLSHFVYSMFPQHILPQSFYISCRDMQAVFRTLYDPHGIKRALFKKFTAAESLPMAYISPIQLSEQTKQFVLGLDGRPWLDPVSGEERQESFGQLYSLAVEDLQELNQLWPDFIVGKNLDAIKTSFSRGINHDGKEPNARRTYHNFVKLFAY